MAAGWWPGRPCPAGMLTRSRWAPERTSPISALSAAPVSLLLPRRWSAGLAPAGLGPELVPSVEVVKVLPTVNNPAVLELEDNAVAHIQVLAVSVGGAALHTDHSVLIICEHVLQVGPKGAPCLLSELAEVGKGRLAALVVVSEAALPRQVPDGALVEQFGECVHVGRVEGLIGAPHDRRVLICSHRFHLLVDLGPPAHYSAPSPAALSRESAAPEVDQDAAAGRLRCVNRLLRPTPTSHEAFGACLPV